MPAASYILAIDQGTTSTRSMVFDAAGRPLSTAQREFAQHYPHDGWVEHDPENIWSDVLITAAEAIGQAGLRASQVAAIGITNQRETVVIWDRASGAPIHSAIVWQDRRTAPLCGRLRAAGHEPLVRGRTGLLLDPYFSATKAAWILDHVEGARARAERGELALGTIDSFLLWRLTGGAAHATDVTNAARTLLYDIHAQRWDEELCALFRVPMAMLPQVEDCSHAFGTTSPDLFGAPILIGGIAGDQQAALVGQACFEPGSVKSTYGTGCFLLLNTGERAITAPALLTTPAYRIGGRMTYALEGSIFAAGAAVKWLRDGIGIIDHASQTGDMATRIEDNGGVYMVPAFVGLGAPHWDPDARGAITGLTFDTRAAHLARAALEAVAYQTLDLIEAMVAGGGGTPSTIHVDGGMAANEWLCQFLADMVQIPVERPRHLETTALGAAFLAGLTVGIWPDPAAIAATRQPDRQYLPVMGQEKRARLISGWSRALASTLTRGCHVRPEPPLPPNTG
ncbi:MAG: glycerol kinase GlpK [Sphingobium sp.]